MIQENRKCKEGEKSVGREIPSLEREEDLSVESVSLRLALMEEPKQEQEVCGSKNSRQVYVRNCQGKLHYVIMVWF